MQSFELLQGDCTKVLATLPAASIQCCVTSPPYWGLRDYGTAQWEGGDSECEHKRDHFGSNPSEKQLSNSGSAEGHARLVYSTVCGKCGAKRIDSQLGLEETPEEYVANMVLVFREVRRVLRDDGTLWLNLGDSYAGNNSRASNNGRAGFGIPREGVFERTGAGLKSKDLVGIPWRVAFALQADGWWLRQDIIWAKPNPMPESVTDRCTKSHEYIFLLTKSAKYFYDNEAVKENSLHVGVTHRAANKGKAHSGEVGLDTRPKVDWTTPETRNKRSVWTVATRPFKEAHFATFPPELIEPCVLASTSHFGMCAECKAPYKRIVERGEIPDRTTRDNTLGVIPGRDKTTRLNSVDMAVIPTETTGWGKTCNCTTDAVEPCVILDPFSGAGTTGVVAIKHSRCYIGTELNPDYVEISRKRIQAEWDGITLPMF